MNEREQKLDEFEEGGKQPQKFDQQETHKKDYDPWADDPVFLDNAQISDDHSSSKDLTQPDVNAQSDVNGDQSQKETHSDKPKAKANPVILAVAAVAGISVLGGVAWFVMSILGQSGSAETVETDMQPPAQMAQAPNSVEENLSSDPLFGDLEGNPDADKNAEMVPDPFASVDDPASQSSQASAETTNVQTSSSEAVSPAKQLTQKNEQSAQSQNLAGKSQAGLSSGKGEKPKQEVQTTSFVEQEQKPRRVKRVAKASKKKTNIAKAECDTKPVDTKPVLTNNEERPKPVSSPDRVVRVFAVYPQSGPHAQAWLHEEPGGVFRVVREGDMYRGVRVRSVKPEQMLVVLENGRALNAHGWTTWEEPKLESKLKPKQKSKRKSSRKKTASTC